jgi:hypothetical protein
MSAGIIALIIAIVLVGVFGYSALIVGARSDRKDDDDE